MGSTSHQPHFRPIDNKAVEYTRNKLEIYKKLPLVEVAHSFCTGRHEIACKSEDGRLKSAVMSPPTYLDWAVPINEKEAHSKKPGRLRATQQWFGLVDILLKHGVRVAILEPDFSRKEGVYTRDVAFAIDGRLFAANLKEPVRKGEQKLVEGATAPPPEAIIEGGNVILGNGDSVFLGVGGEGRTNLLAAEWLQGQLGTKREVVPIMLKPGVLHLDCAFCPLEKNGNAPTSALVYSGAFENPKDLEMISKRYPNVLELSHAEYDSLGLNVFKLDRRTVIVHNASERIAKLLRQLGIEVIRYDYSEIIKGGGSYRCTFMPIQREN